MASPDFQRWKLAIIAALSSSVVTFSALKVYDSVERRRRRKELDLEVTKSIAKHGPGHIPAPDEAWGHNDQPRLPGPPDLYDESLIREQLVRNYAFFGDEGMAKIRASTVVIVGCGGVGSHAALMLARSGVAKIRLIDFDYVTLSSLNRHAAAVLSDVGAPKVKCLKRAIGEFARWVDVDARVDIWRKDEGGDALLEGADWVIGEGIHSPSLMTLPTHNVRIDAIDNITTKVDLLKFCYDNKIKACPSVKFHPPI